MKLSLATNKQNCRLILIWACQWETYELIQFCSKPGTWLQAVCLTYHYTVLNSLHRIQSCPLSCHLDLLHPPHPHLHGHHQDSHTLCTSEWCCVSCQRWWRGSRMLGENSSMITWSRQGKSGRSQIHEIFKKYMECKNPTHLSKFIVFYLKFNA